MLERPECPTLFEHLSGVTLLKRPWESTSLFGKNYTQIMINRFIGMQDVFLDLIQELNKLTLTNEQHYNMLLTYLPKKRFFFKYIKKGGSILDMASINVLVDLYNISYGEVEELIKVAPIKEIRRIISEVTKTRGLLRKVKSIQN